MIEKSINTRGLGFAEALATKTSDRGEDTTGNTANHQVASSHPCNDIASTKTDNPFKTDGGKGIAAEASESPVPIHDGPTTSVDFVAGACGQKHQNPGRVPFHLTTRLVQLQAHVQRIRRLLDVGELGESLPVTEEHVAEALRLREVLKQSSFVLERVPNANDATLVDFQRSTTTADERASPKEGQTSHDTNGDTTSDAIRPDGVSDNGMLEAFDTRCVVSEHTTTVATMEAESIRNDETHSFKTDDDDYVGVNSANNTEDKYPINEPFSGSFDPRPSSAGPSLRKPKFVLAYKTPDPKLEADVREKMRTRVTELFQLYDTLAEDGLPRKRSWAHPHILKDAKIEDFKPVIDPPGTVFTDAYGVLTSHDPPTEDSHMTRGVYLERVHAGNGVKTGGPGMELVTSGPEGDSDSAASLVQDDDWEVLA